MSLLCKRQTLKMLLGYYRQNNTTLSAKTRRTISVLPFTNAKQFYDKTAVYDSAGSYTFGNILISAKELSHTFSEKLDGKTNERVLFLCPNDVSYVIVLWAIWMSGQIAVPLSPLHPKSILQYYADDTSSKLLVTTPQYKEIMANISKVDGANLYIIDEDLRKRTMERKRTIPHQELGNGLPLEFYKRNNAFILYTSGTTGNPKGVVLSYKNLSVQISTLLKAWRWSSNDVMLHTLPLHHVHGTVNALFCPLSVGATTIMLPKFSAQTVWSHLLGIDKNLNEKVSVFMAVPTIYSKLLEEYEKGLRGQKDHITNHLKNTVRLMISGSAPLPGPLYEGWLEISGHKLLERYGMTEIGMCLSNEYDSDRTPGYVGVPLPGVSIKLSEDGNDVHDTFLECTNRDGTIIFNKKVDKSIHGELLVKGDGIFKEYFNKPQATKKEFTDDGWFKTGDMCEYCAEKKLFRMLGRISVDIIKSGGYKISALQIETKLLAHPDIKECVVVGVKDDVWGEKIAAVVILASGSSLTLDNLRDWAADKMPKYSLPTLLKIVEEIPKNAMGKVNKKELVKNVFTQNNY